MPGAGRPRPPAKEERRRHFERLGICLDTHHLFAAGDDLSTETGYHEVMMAECNQVLEQERVHCTHLEMGKGALGLTPFPCLMKDPRFVNPLGILETLRHLESPRRRK